MRSAAESESVLVRASDIRSKRVRWAWQGYLPLGYQSIMSGETKLGKTTFVTWALANLTRGELPGQFHGQPVGVLVIAVEDGLDDLWKPRLEAADADLDHVHFLKIPDNWNVRDGVGLIEMGLNESGAAIVFTDAVMEHLPDSKGSENANSVTFVRGALRPMANLYQRRNVAGLMSTHPPKGRAGGFADAYHSSGAFVHVSRSCLLFGWHPEDHDLADDQRRRVLVRAAANIGRDPGALSFRIGGKTIRLDDGSDDEAGYAYNVAACNVTARQMLDAERRVHAGSETGAKQPTKIEQLQDRIRSYLADGEWHPSIRPELEAEGYAGSRIQDARRRVAAARRTPGEMVGHWEWRLHADSNSSNSTDSRTQGKRSRAGGLSPKADSRTQGPQTTISTEESVSPSSSTNTANSFNEESVSPLVRETDSRTLGDLTDAEITEIFPGATMTSDTHPKRWMSSELQDLN